MNYTAQILPSEGRMSINPGAAGATRELMAGRLRVPLIIPAAQAYYWRHSWQQGERESLAALEAGQTVVFDSDDPEDIVRWLHASDEPDADQD